MAVSQRPEVPPTSLAETTPRKNEVTVQFRRWHAWQNTAYMRGQQAGFLPHEADELARRGIAVIVHDLRRVGSAGPPMVQK